MKKGSYYYIEHLIERYPILVSLKENIANAINLLIDTTKNNGTYLVCGNGGSAADSDHIVGELMKGFVLKRTITNDLSERILQKYPEDYQYLTSNLQQGISAISLVSHNALISAFSNDKAPDLIFAQQVLGYGKSGDTLIAISTSGNSKNVVHAAQIAKVMGLNVISLTGNTGGKLRDLSDVLINVPEIETYKIQEYHLPIYHCICLAIENEFFGE
jgi:D-sedoheptulose 7-phosphate isomerase